MLINAFAIVVLLMIPVVPVGLVLLVLGLRGRLVWPAMRCPACQNPVQEAPAAARPISYCQACGSPLPPAPATGVAQRRRNPALLISGILLTATLPAVAIILLAVGVVQAALTAVAAAGTPPVVAPATPPSPAVQQAPVASTPQLAPVAPEMPEIGKTPAEVMVAFSKAMIAGDEQTMMACFSISDPSHLGAITVGVAKKAATVRFANEKMRRFGTDQEKKDSRQSQDEIIARWAEGTFQEHELDGTLTPAPGKTNLVARHFTKTPAGWRLDSETALRQNTLGLTGSLSFDQEKSESLNAISAKVRDGQYASRDEADRAWQQAQSDAGRRDMDRIRQAISATSQPSGER